MNTYTCPMHPEIQQSKPGHCPKCGMELVLKKDLKRNSTPENNKFLEITWKSYLPLLVIVGLIFVVSLFIGIKDYEYGMFSISNTISYFMAGFFIVFAGFKLIDLKGFASGYYTYDLLARRWFPYGYIYPFIELFFGLSMILGFQIKLVLFLEFIVMIFSGIGVAIKLVKREKFQCACLGTFFKVPLTKVTLIEDFGMALLALIMLFFNA